MRILDQDGSVYSGQVINEESYAAGILRRTVVAWLRKPARTQCVD